MIEDVEGLEDVVQVGLFNKEAIMGVVEGAKEEADLEESSTAVSSGFKTPQPRNHDSIPNQWCSFYGCREG